LMRHLRKLGSFSFSSYLSWDKLIFEDAFDMDTACFGLYCGNLEFLAPLTVLEPRGISSLGLAGTAISTFVKLYLKRIWESMFLSMIGSNLL
jgi:hypothetical protein